MLNLRKDPFCFAASQNRVQAYSSTKTDPCYAAGPHTASPQHLLESFDKDFCCQGLMDLSIAGGGKFVLLELAF